MKQVLCKGILATLCGATLLASACVSVIGFQADAATPARAWETVKPAGETPWTVDTETGIVTATAANNDSLTNFFVTKDENAVGNYSVEATFKMTENPLASAAGNSQFGIVPFYWDANNYVMVNCWWRTDDWCGGNGNVLANITMQGRQNGEFLHVYTGGAGGVGTYNPAEYSDVWINNAAVSNDTYRVPINREDGWTFKINKRIGDSSWGADYRGDIYEFNLNGVVLGHYVTDLSAAYRAQPCYVGISQRNANGLTVSNFEVADVDLSGIDFNHSDYNYNPLDGADGFVATGKTWGYNEGVYSSNAITGVRAESPHDALIKVNADYLNYMATADVAITQKAQSGESEAGLVAWKKDINNVLNANLVCEDGAYKAVIRGKIGGENVLVENAVSITADAATLQVEKKGALLVLSVNDTEVCTYTNPAISTNGFAGMNTRNAAATFANFTVSEIAYNSFDEYEVTLFGKTYTASTEALDDLMQDENLVTVDATDFEEFGYAVIDRDTWSETTVSATVTPSQTQSGYAVGLIGYYRNTNDYYYAIVDGANAKIFHHTETEEVQLATATYAYDGSSALALSMVVEAGKITFKNGETELVFATVSNFNPDSGRAGGVIFRGLNCSFTDISFEGWRTWDAITVGEWTVIGPELNTWSVAQDGTISGDVSVKKVERNTTYALKEIEFESNYYVYGTVKVTAVHENWERRAYYFPWYIDNDNWVGVYCSHVPGLNPEIVAEGKIGGQSIAMGWTNYAGYTAILNVDVVMEVYVGDNGIEIYNGLTLESMFEFQVPGLAAAAEGRQVKAGVGVVDVACSFKNFTVSETRVGVNTGKPVITLLNTPATSVTKGATVTFPIVDVVDDQGESITRSIAVTDPDGAAVQIENGSRFVANKVGTYTVTITAEDSWGNEADPYTYTITVSEAADEPSDGPSDNPAQTPSDDPSDDPKEEGGCGSVVIGGISAALLAIGAGVAVFARKRK